MHAAVLTLEINGERRRSRERGRGEKRERGRGTTYQNKCNDEMNFNKRLQENRIENLGKQNIDAGRGHER